MSLESKRKMSIAKKGTILTERHKLKLRNRKNVKQVINLETLEIYPSLMDVSRKLNLSSGSLCDVLNEKTITIHGLYLSYLPNDIENLELWSKNKLEELKEKKIYRDTKKYQYKQVICLNTGEIFESMKLAASILNCKQGLISKVCKKQRKSTNGLKFEYYGEK